MLMVVMGARGSGIHDNYLPGAGGLGIHEVLSMRYNNIFLSFFLCNFILSVPLRFMVISTFKLFLLFFFFLQNHIFIITIPRKQGTSTEKGSNILQRGRSSKTTKASYN
jgi:hypothetical protein